MAWRHCHLLCTIGVCNRGVASLQMYNSTFQTTLDASYWAICKGKGQTLVVWPWRSLSMTRTSRSKVQFRQLSSICQFFFAEDANWGVILTLNSSRSVAGEANVVRKFRAFSTWLAQSQNPFHVDVVAKSLIKSPIPWEGWTLRFLGPIKYLPNRLELINTPTYKTSPDPMIHSWMRELFSNYHTQDLQFQLASSHHGSISLCWTHYRNHTGNPATPSQHSIHLATTSSWTFDK